MTAEQWHDPLRGHPSEDVAGPLTLTDEFALDPLLADEVTALQRRRRAREIVAEREAARDSHPAPDVATLAELLVRPRGVRWRVEGLIPAGGRMLLSAQRKTGKTTLTGNLFRSLLIGDPFLGRFDVERLDGRVVVLNYEVSGETYADWMADIGVPPERLVVVNLRGRRNLLADTAGRADLASVIRRHEGQVLAVDPFGRAFTGKSQNDAGEVAPWLVRLDEVAEGAGVDELILTAHAGWEGERTRGSSALEDWPDAIVTMTRDANTDARFLKAEGRDVDVDEDQLRFDPVGRRLTMTGAGNRRTVRTAGHLNELAEAVAAIVAESPGVNVRGISEGLRAAGHHVQKGDENKAAALACERGWVRREVGPRRSWRHFPAEVPLKAPTSPESPPGVPLTTPDPPYRTGVSQVATDSLGTPARDREFTGTLAQLTAPSS